MTVGPLTGFVIGVAADRRSEEQIELLSRKGADVLHGPTIRTIPLTDEEGLVTATRAVIERPPDLTLLTTGIGVRGWFEAAASLDLGEELLEALRASQILTRGQKAQGAAVTAGLTPDWQAASGTGAELLAELARRGASGRRVAVQLDGAAHAPLATAVTQLGAEVVAVPIYRWTGPEHADAAGRLLAAIVARRVDAVTFTARPQIENLCELAAEAGLAEEVGAALRGGVIPVCIGPVCAEAAAEAGFGRPIVPGRYRLGAMVHTLAAEFADRAIDLELAGVPLRLQGRAVVTGSDVLRLTEREGELLNVLASSFGTVMSKRQLLQRVWRGETDEHLVEVTVARLRHRLGAAGMGVETVFRRGYRLSAA